MPGKKGNTNALKHGLYAKNFTDLERKELKRMSEDDLRFEIAACRLAFSKIMDTITGKKPDMEKAIPQLYAAGTVLNTLVKTHALLSGNYSPLDDALQEALDNVIPYPTEP